MFRSMIIEYRKKIGQRLSQVRISESNENDVTRSLATPFGQIPVLEADGKQLAQSYAINRFLARKYGMLFKRSFLNF